MFDSARSNLTELFRTQPLALGAIGLAIGAGIAAALPSSEVEAAYLGETSDTVKAQVADFAAEQTARATAVAEDVMGAATEEAREGTYLRGREIGGRRYFGKGRPRRRCAGKGISERATSTKSS